MREVVQSREVVLIGGQAVSLWVAQLENRLGGLTPELVASKDIDFQGDSRAFMRAAELLDGEGRVPRFDEHPPMSGVAIFRDSEGWARHLDFLPQPHGLQGKEVAAQAVEIAVTDPAGDEIPFFVMHPFHVLESRVCNLSLPSKQGDLSWRQLRAAIECARAFHLALLDLAGENELDATVRRVLNYNERVFRLATNNRQARHEIVDQGMEVFDAVLVDDRLPRLFAEIRLPQMRAAVAAVRDRDMRPTS